MRLKLWFWSIRIGKAPNSLGLTQEDVACEKALKVLRERRNVSRDLTDATEKVLELIRAGKAPPGDAP